MTTSATDTNTTDMEDNNNKKDLDPDPVSGLSLAFDLFVLHLKQHAKVSELTVVGRKLLLMMLATGCLSVTAMMLAAEERVKQQFKALSAIQ